MTASRDQPHSLRRDSASARAAPEYANTSALHPQIIRDEPGSSPLSGMALEPRVVKRAEKLNPELADMQRRFGVSRVLTPPTTDLALGNAGWIDECGAVADAICLFNPSRSKSFVRTAPAC